MEGQQPTMLPGDSTKAIVCTGACLLNRFDRGLDRRPRRSQIQTQIPPPPARQTHGLANKRSTRAWAETGRACGGRRGLDPRADAATTDRLKHIFRFFIVIALWIRRGGGRPQAKQIDLSVRVYGLAVCACT